MFDITKFLEEKRKKALPPGIADLSKAPRVSRQSPRQEAPSFVPDTKPPPDMWQTSHPSQQVIPEQQKVVEQLKAIFQLPAVDTITKAVPTYQPVSPAL